MRTKLRRTSPKNAKKLERGSRRGAELPSCVRVVLNGDELMQNVVQLHRHGRPNFRERIADVEELLAIDDPKPLIVKVSRTERILMELLLKRNMLTREVAWGVLYGHRPDADQPQYRVISTIIHHLRDRLSPHGVEITTDFGTGWYLKDKDRDKLEQLLKCRP